MDAPRRRLVFGVNVVVQAILAAAIMVAVIWAAGRFNFQADLTGTGRNSLSTRTVQLLRGLKENIRITAVFAEPDKRDEIGQKRRRAMRDLLDLYEQAGGARVTTGLLDPSLEKAETDRLLQRLPELPAYKDEARPHQEALTKAAELTEQMKALLEEESGRADQLARSDPQLGRSRNFAIVRNNLRQIGRQAADLQEKMQDLTHGEFPRYGQAVREVRDFLTGAETLLRDATAWMSGDGLNTPGLSGDGQTFFRDSPERFKDLLDQTRALLEQTQNLKDVKVEEIYTGLTRWRTGPPVLVESEHEARLIPFWDLWVPPSEPGAPIGPDGDDRIFAGESAISSAILQLTQKEKTAVIFTRCGGEPLLRPDFSRMNPMMMQMPRAPYQELNGLLEKANFLTQEWDVSTQKTPPVVENAARVIYVVLPPEPPSQPDPRRPSPSGLSPEDRKIILDAVESSGMAVFLTGWMSPSSPLPGATGRYDFADYLKSNWGIEVHYNHLALQFMPHPEKPGQWAPAGRQPQLLTTDNAVRFTDHPIGAPLAADRAGFVMAAPLSIVSDTTRPAGLKIETVAEVRPTQDVWAAGDLSALEDQLKRNQAVRRGPSDIPAPFAIALAATKEPASGAELGGPAAEDSAGSAGPASPTTQGQPSRPQRIVVFGSEHFATDQIAQATGIQQRGNALILGQLYPANADLFINALHWLTGEADRIAVGPRKGDLPRLRDLDEVWAARLPWVLVGFWPALALAVGVGVWFVRRR